MAGRLKILGEEICGRSCQFCKLSLAVMWQGRKTFNSLSFSCIKKNCSFSSNVLVLNLEIPCENPTPNATHTAHFGDKHCCQLKVYCLIFSQSVLFKIFISIFPLYIFFSQKSFLTESWQKVPFPS